MSHCRSNLHFIHMLTGQLCRHIMVLVMRIIRTCDASSFFELQLCLVMRLIHTCGLQRVPNPAATAAVAMATPLSVKATNTSLGSKGKGLTTKLNATVSNITSNTAASARQHELSHSDYNSADWSSNGSDGSNSAGVMPFFISFVAFNNVLVLLWDRTTITSIQNTLSCNRDLATKEMLLLKIDRHQLSLSKLAYDRKSDTDSNPVNDGERSTSLRVSSGVSGTAGQAFSVKKKWHTCAPNNYVTWLWQCTF